MADHGLITRRAALVGAIASTAVLAAPIAAAIETPDACVASAQGGEAELLAAIRDFKVALAEETALGQKILREDWPGPRHGSGPTHSAWWDASERKHQLYLKMMERIFEHVLT